MRKSQGITLLELLVTVTILGILASLASVTYRKNQVSARLISSIVSLDGLKSALTAFVQESTVPTNSLVIPSPASLGYTFPTSAFSSVTTSANASPTGIAITAVVNNTAIGLPVSLTITLFGCFAPSSDPYQNKDIRWGCFSTSSDKTYLPSSCTQDVSNFSAFCS